LHLVGILFPHINDDARSKSHQKWQDQVYAYFMTSLKAKGRTIIGQEAPDGE